MATRCELLHTASLIHDDLQDRDYLRRGKQAVWSLFGNDVPCVRAIFCFWKLIRRCQM